MALQRNRGAENENEASMAGDGIPKKKIAALQARSINLLSRSIIVLTQQHERPK